MIKRLKGFFLTAILTASLIGATATHAKADTYRAGEFTITLDDGENGKTYRGCDVQGKCIDLDYGTSWRDKYLNIYNKDKQILRRQLVAITENVATLKWATSCDVVNIKSGQLALRDSPNGQSRAGLNNGNNVLLKEQEGIWAYVSVIQGPNTRVNGLSGWVNSNYLHCTKEPID